MRQFQKFIGILALVFLPMPVLAQGLVILETHTSTPQGGMNKPSTVPSVMCYYDSLTHALTICVDNSGYSMSRNIIAKILVISTSTGEEVYSTREITPTKLWLPLPSSGEYYILVSLSSGQDYWGWLSV